MQNRVRQGSNHDERCGYESRLVLQEVPDPTALVVTKEWGEVPANQIGVVMVEGGDRKDAEKLARWMPSQSPVSPASTWYGAS